MFDIKIKRRRLGTVYTRSPAQLARKWMVDNTSKIIFAIIGCLGWLAILYVLIGVVTFVGGNVAEMWDRDIATSVIYNHPYAAPIKVIGAVFVVLYVFRDKSKI